MGTRPYQLKLHLVQTTCMSLFLQCQCSCPSLTSDCRPIGELRNRLHTYISTNFARINVDVIFRECLRSNVTYLVRNQPTDNFLHTFFCGLVFQLLPCSLWLP